MTATITNIQQALRATVGAMWDCIEPFQRDFIRDITRAWRLAAHHDPERTAALMTDYRPQSIADADDIYRALLAISADAINAKLSQIAANDDYNCLQ